MAQAATTSQTRGYGKWMSAVLVCFVRFSLLCLTPSSSPSSSPLRSVTLDVVVIVVVADAAPSTSSSLRLMTLSVVVVVVVVVVFVAEPAPSSSSSLRLMTPDVVVVVVAAAAVAIVNKQRSALLSSSVVPRLMGMSEPGEESTNTQAQCTLTK